MIEEGKLTFSWDDPEAEGVTLPDGTAIFKAHFISSGGPEINPTLRFMDHPTAREVVIDRETARLATEETSLGAPEEPRVQILRTSEGGKPRTSIIVSTALGKTYILEHASNLTRPEWRELRRLVGDGAPRVIVDETAEEGQRFYRVTIR